MTEREPSYCLMLSMIAEVANLKTRHHKRVYFKIKVVSPAV